MRQTGCQPAEFGSGLCFESKGRVDDQHAAGMHLALTACAGVNRAFQYIAMGESSDPTNKAFGVMCLLDRIPYGKDAV